MGIGRFGTPLIHENFRSSWDVLWRRRPADSDQSGSHLLELCPSSGKVLASTRSERGGARLGLRAGVDDEDSFDFEEAESGALEFCAQAATLATIKRANNRLRMHLFYVSRAWSGMPPGSVGRVSSSG